MAPRTTEIFRAADITHEITGLAREAYMAAVRCQGDRARRLRKAVRAKIKLAEAQLAMAPADAIALYGTDDVVRRILASTKAEMKRLDKLLKQCRPSSRVPFKKSGSFKGTKDMQTGQAGNNTINIKFTLDKAVECERLCLISVYYIENDATGEIQQNPSDGYKDGFDNIYGGTLPDSDAAGGFIVDAPARRDPTGGLNFQPSNNPCMPTSKKAGLVITAEDSPMFIKPGFTAWFETCLVCLDERPKFRILGSMRWSYAGSETRIKRRKKKINRKSASDGFIQALEKYIANHP